MCVRRSIYKNQAESRKRTSSGSDDADNQQRERERERNERKRTTIFFWGKRALLPDDGPPVCDSGMNTRSPDTSVLRDASVMPTEYAMVTWHNRKRGCAVNDAYEGRRDAYPAAKPYYDELDRIYELALSRAQVFARLHKTVEGFGGETYAQYRLWISRQTKEGLRSVDSGDGPTVIFSNKSDTLGAARQHKKTYPAAEGKIAAVNFANAVTVGGGDARARGTSQEESLFRHTYLRVPLEQFCRSYISQNAAAVKSCGRYIPYYGAIWSPGVPTMGREDSEEFNYISSAAPNLSIYSREWVVLELARFTHPGIVEQILERKTEMIASIAAAKHQEVLVLGAYGCGAFAGNPEQVANVVVRVLQHYPTIKHVVMPIGAHDANRAPFEQAFRKSGYKFAGELQIPDDV